MYFYVQYLLKIIYILVKLEFIAHKTVVTALICGEYSARKKETWNHDLIFRKRSFVLIALTLLRFLFIKPASC